MFSGLVKAFMAHWPKVLRNAPWILEVGTVPDNSDPVRHAFYGAVRRGVAPEIVYVRSPSPRPA
jgi:hypothetical protein